MLARYRRLSRSSCRRLVVHETALLLSGFYRYSDKKPLSIWARREQTAWKIKQPLRLTHDDWIAGNRRGHEPTIRDVEQLATVLAPRWIVSTTIRNHYSRTAAERLNVQAVRDGECD